MSHVADAHEIQRVSKESHYKKKAEICKIDALGHLRPLLFTIMEESIDWKRGRSKRRCAWMNDVAKWMKIRAYY